jgi:hypothetical protein
MMRSWLLAAGLLAAAAVLPAQAADLDGEEPPPPNGWPHSGPYGGPSYADPGYRRPTPPPSAYRDDDDDDDDRYSAVPGPRKYSNVPPRYAPSPPTKPCVRSEQVRDRLSGEGWQDFHDGKPASDGLVVMRARRPSGRLFELTLHRCSGEVVEVRPLESRSSGPYAYRRPDGPYRPWRWGPERAPYAQDNDDGWEERSYAQRGQQRWHDDD